jgi:hypothetical protein
MAQRGSSRPESAAATCGVQLATCKAACGGGGAKKAADGWPTAATFEPLAARDRQQVAIAARAVRCLAHIYDRAHKSKHKQQLRAEENGASPAPAESSIWWFRVPACSVCVCRHRRGCCCPSFCDHFLPLCKFPFHALETRQFLQQAPSGRNNAVRLRARWPAP